MSEGGVYRVDIEVLESTERKDIKIKKGEVEGGMKKKKRAQ